MNNVSSITVSKITKGSRVQIAQDVLLRWVCSGEREGKGLNHNLTGKSNALIIELGMTRYWPTGLTLPPIRCHFQLSIYPHPFTLSQLAVSTKPLHRADCLSQSRLSPPPNIFWTLCLYCLLTIILCLGETVVNSGWSIGHESAHSTRWIWQYKITLQLYL